MAMRKKNYSDTWRPTYPGPEGPKKSMPTTKKPTKKPAKKIAVPGKRPASKPKLQKLPAIKKKPKQQIS